MDNYTQHAAQRIQQRAIPPLVVDWLFDYGKMIYDRGCEVFFFDKEARRKLRSDIGRRPYKKMESLLNCYAVVTDSRVVTVGKRYKRIHR